MLRWTTPKPTRGTACRRPGQHRPGLSETFTGTHTDIAPPKKGSFEHVVLSTTCRSFPVFGAAYVCSDPYANTFNLENLLEEDA